MTKLKKNIITPRVILIKENNDMDKILSFLRSGDEVIVNVSLIDIKDSIRVINFLSGFVYAYNGKRNKIEDKIYMFKL